MAMDDKAPGQANNAWLEVTDEPPVRGLHATLKWLPYLHVGDGYKAIGYRREDGSGYVLPVFSDQNWALTGDWWATWAHPMMCGRPGWHHHALGRYVDAQVAAMAFDKVYDLELTAGNSDRCAELKVPRQHDGRGLTPSTVVPAEIP